MSGSFTPISVHTIRLTRKRPEQKRFPMNWLLVALISVFVRAHVHCPRRWLGPLDPGWGMPMNSQRHGNPPLTPAWALEPGLGGRHQHSRIHPETVNGHLAHDFPVRTVLIDSPWLDALQRLHRGYEARFPNPEIFFRSLDQRGIRVVLWMTSMVNSESKDTALTTSPDLAPGGRRPGLPDQRGLPD